MALVLAVGVGGGVVVVAMAVVVAWCGAACVLWRRGRLWRAWRRGGVWPSGYGATRLSDYVDRIFQLSDVVGPDHVAFGTDMDGNYKPVLSSYRQVPLVISELLRRGYGEKNAEKFAGGNFRRLWTDVWRAKTAAHA